MVDEDEITALKRDRAFLIEQREEAWQVAYRAEKAATHYRKERDEARSQLQAFFCAVDQYLTVKTVETIAEMRDAALAAEAYLRHCFGGKTDG